MNGLVPNFLFMKYVCQHANNLTGSQNSCKRKFRCRIQMSYPVMRGLHLCEVNSGSLILFDIFDPFGERGYDSLLDISYFQCVVNHQNVPRQVSENYRKFVEYIW